MTPNQFAYRLQLASRMLPHGVRPTRKQTRIGCLLAHWQHREPSHAKLARAARCCVRTVQNALQRFRKLGMLDWLHRYRRLRSGQWHQIANRYLFIASFLLLAAPRCTKQEKIQNPVLPVGKLPPITPEHRAALLAKWGLAPIA